MEVGKENLRFSVDKLELLQKEDSANFQDLAYNSDRSVNYLCKNFDGQDGSQMDLEHYRELIEQSGCDDGEQSYLEAFTLKQITQEIDV